MPATEQLRTEPATGQDDPNVGITDVIANVEQAARRFAPNKPTVTPAASTPRASAGKPKPSPKRTPPRPLRLPPTPRWSCERLRTWRFWNC